MAENSHGQRHDRTALILYGSETGNSQEVAEELGRILERLHFKTRVSEMDLIVINELLKYTVVIFAISTTGQGEFPKNGQKLWKSLLRKRLPPGCLSQVTFTTFGLGDSSYPRFNWSSRKLHKRLEQLGAQEVYPRGEGDDQHEEGFGGAFIPWSVDIRKHLLSTYPLPEGVLPLAPDAILPFKYHLVFLADQQPQLSSHPETENIEAMDSINFQPKTDMDRVSIEWKPKTDMDQVTAQLEKVKEKFKKITSSEAGVARMDSGYASISGVKEGPRDDIVRARHLGFEHMLGLRAPLRSIGVNKDDMIEHYKDPNPTIATTAERCQPPIDRLPIPNGIDIKLMKNERMTPAKHWQDVRKLTFTMEQKKPTLRTKKSNRTPEEEKVFKAQQRWNHWERGELPKEEVRGFREIPDGWLEATREEDEMDDYEKEYHPGDVVTIYPKNFFEDVEKLIRRMGWEDVADQPACFESTDIDMTSAGPLDPSPPNLYTLRPMTLRNLLLHNLDITAVPNPHFFNCISQYATDSIEQERLRELGSAYYQEDYFEYVTRPRRTCLEIFHDFSSVKIPSQFAANLFHVIRGRQFSIASGGDLYHRTEYRPMITLELVVAIVKYKTILRKPRHGLCSRYLASLEAGTIVKVNLEPKNKFYSYAKAHPHLPIIMIAPGTGVAPCRALIWERAEQRKKRAEQRMEKVLERRSQKLHNHVYTQAQQYLTNSQGEVREDNWAFNTGTWPLKRDLILKPERGIYDDYPELKLLPMVSEKPSTKGKEVIKIHAGDPEDERLRFGENVLFFGNRNHNADYLFKEDWVNNKNLRVEVFTAFSRDQRAKIYIQDEIRKQGKLVWSLLRMKAIVYVCGSSGAMPKLVKQALVDVIAEYGCGGKSVKGMVQAEKYLKELEEKGSYIQETW